MCLGTLTVKLSFCLPFRHVAARVPPPQISAKFLQPVNDVSSESSIQRGKILANELVQTANRRCLEWTTDYVKLLVVVGYIGEDAVSIVQAQRDPPSHGIGLLPAGRRQGGRG